MSNAFEMIERCARTSEPPRAHADLTLAEQAAIGMLRSPEHALPCETIPQTDQGLEGHGTFEMADELPAPVMDYGY